MPQRAVLENITIVNHPDTKTWSVVGFAPKATWMFLHDGETDHLETMPRTVQNAVKTSYGSMKKLRDKLGVIKSDAKIIVIMLESYVSKGPDYYDLQDPKVRKGYGTIKVSLAPRDLNQTAIEGMFKTGVSAKPPPTEGITQGEESQRAAPVADDVDGEDHSKHMAEAADATLHALQVPNAVS